MTNIVKEAIADSDFVLIGIGEEMELAGDKLSGFEDEVRRSYAAAHIEENHPIPQAYEKLAELVGDKNYFVVTMAADELIRAAGFDPERITAPCGSMLKFQCSQHIWDGREEIERMVRENRFEKPSCPICQQQGEFHVISRLEKGAYLESGYLESWQAYTRWMQQTMAKKICILELGVGFAYPTVVRWPFEKMAFINQKAQFFRVHSELYQMPEELKGRGTPIQADPVSFLAGL